MDEYINRLRANWAASLKSHRRLHRLSQTSLAGKAGVPQSRISEIENCERLPSEAMKVRLAGALLVSVSVLFPYPSDIPVLDDVAA